VALATAGAVRVTGAVLALGVFLAAGLLTIVSARSRACRCVEPDRRRHARVGVAIMAIFGARPG
jgi:hypothetical protein